MRIRSKLLALIAVPLIAISLSAAFGFRSQSAAIETAEDSLAAVTTTQLVHDAVLSVGAERLGHATGNSTTELQAETDVALGALAASEEAAEVRVVVDRVVGLVEQARGAGSAEGVEIYVKANQELLDAFADRAAAYPSAAIRNDAIVNRGAVVALEAREDAWFDYLASASSAPSDAEGEAAAAPSTTLIASFTRSSLMFENTLDVAAGTTTADLDRVLQSQAARDLNTLEIVAIDDIEEGTLSIAPELIIPALVEFRTEWSGAIEAQSQQLREVVGDELTAANDLRSLFSLLAVVGVVVGAGLIFVIYRSITRPLDALLTRAGEVANVDLPDLVTTLRVGDDDAELPEARPIESSSSDEVGELVDAFNDVQITAYQLATEQALGRRAVGEMFVNLGRRNQHLLQRILGRLTELQRDEEDPETLRALFELDNIVTRMRRNAESLLVLAGASTPRQWSQSVSIDNAVRAAFGEVEGYERIDIAALAPVELRGNVVADVAHLLAELLENALNFSESNTMVLVSGQFEKDGYLLSIFDQGIGMTPEELAENNSRISDPPPVDQVPTRFLGLFVVGRLADRHGIKVRLVEAPGSGVMARVEFPSALLMDSQGSLTSDGDGFDELVDGLDVLDNAVAAELAEPEQESASEPAVLESISTEVPETSPLEQEHDPDTELALMTSGDLPTRVSDAPRAEVSAEDGVSELRQRFEDSKVSREIATAPTPNPAAATPVTDQEAAMRMAEAFAEDPATPQPASVPPRADLPAPPAAPVRPATDPAPQPAPAPDIGSTALPVRNAGSALTDAGPVAGANTQAGPPETTSSSANDAGGFSSMMSALSSGVARGLQDSQRDESDHEGEQR